MGTWGTGSFENDTAGDGIWGLKPAKKSLLGKPKDPFAYPMAAIDRLLRSDLYLDANECDEAIAAAEARGLKVMTVGYKGETLRLVKLCRDGARQLLVVTHKAVPYQVNLPLIGDYQAGNALVAAALAAA